MLPAALPTAEPLADDTADLLARLRRRGEDLELRRSALPCYPAAQEGRHGAAADACYAARAHLECEIDGSPSCPRAAERQTVAQAVARLIAARVPGASDHRDHDTRGFRPVVREAPIADHVLAEFTGRRSGKGARLPPVQLLDTDALRLCRALMARRPERVYVGDGEQVQFTGLEWLLLMGGRTGTGKTLASCAQLAVHDGLYVTAPQACAIGEEAPVSLAQMVAAPLLVLDDLGTEQLGEGGWAPKRVNEILNPRYEARRPTIVTTNLRRKRTRPNDPREPEGLAERYGARLDSRMNLAAIVVGLGGADLRSVM